MNKYYTPKWEEFHEGFEYEMLLTNFVPPRVMWVNMVFYLTDYYLHGARYNETRVKWLDSSDIEDLGFILNENIPSDDNGNLYELKGSPFKLRFTEEQREVIIYSTMYYRVDIGVHYAKNDIPIFIGKINNKSELVKLLKQLCITK